LVEPTGGLLLASVTYDVLTELLSRIRARS
jgi:hypothetical protein